MGGLPGTVSNLLTEVSPSKVSSFFLPSLSFPRYFPPLTVFGPPSLLPIEAPSVSFFVSFPLAPDMTVALPFQMFTDPLPTVFPPIVSLLEAPKDKEGKAEDSFVFGEQKALGGFCGVVRERITRHLHG